MTRTVRGGFTLVELLVVMSLVIVLAGLTVAVAESGAFGSQKVVSAADRASGWLLIAKQRALRDGRPRGVRFLLTQVPGGGANAADYRNFSYVAREAQYIEVPDAYVPDRTRPPGQRAFLAFVYQEQPAPGGLFPDTWISPASYSRSATTPNGRRVFAAFPNPADLAEFNQRVEPGSLLSLPGKGVFRIDQKIGPIPLKDGAATVPGFDLVLGQYTSNQGPPYNVAPLFLRPPAFTYPDLGAAATPAPPASPPQITYKEYEFAFTAGLAGSGPGGTGGPLPLVGEPLLQLTGNTVIDYRAPGTNPPLSFSGYRDSTGPAPYWLPTTAGVAPTGAYFDVLFSPSGQVLGGTGEGVIALWVRDPDKTPHPRLDDPANYAGPDNTAGGAFDAAGEQVLVTVYTRTGLIATHPVSRGTDPYTAAKDGLNSGL